jgi:hypothetical protein
MIYQYSREKSAGDIGALYHNLVENTNKRQLNALKSKFLNATPIQPGAEAPSSNQ